MNIYRCRRDLGVIDCIRINTINECAEELCVALGSNFHTTFKKAIAYVLRDIQNDISMHIKECDDLKKEYKHCIGIKAKS